LIIEDHISTGLSCLDAIKTLREQGAIVTDCVSITNFDMAETATLFEEAGVKMHRMIAFNKVVDKAIEMGHITEEQKKTIEDWLKTPWTWAARQGLVAATREN
jgi:orotate phosphoribosyltransferase